jgi:opacity protein-like surface antigen
MRSAEPRPRRGVAGLVLVAVLALVPTAASAQWYGGVFLGGNRTQAADVEIHQPQQATSLTFEEVGFEARPFTSPQYYGFRLGRALGPDRTWGVELEFIHLKVISRTAREYRTFGEQGGEPIDTTTRMDAFVERYSMTHGLNYVLVNLMARRPLAGDAAALSARVGAGPTYPHAESTVGGVAREQYEYAGLGLHGAAGVEVRLRGRWSANVEYKLTASRPQIDIAGGTGRMRAIDHQIAAGLAFGLTR